MVLNVHERWLLRTVGLHRTERRAMIAELIKDAHAGGDVDLSAQMAGYNLVGSPTRVGLFVTWFWAPGWFASQTRYLQRRLNILHDVLASHAVRGQGQ
jgi:hypothetical protein